MHLCLVTYFAIFVLMFVQQTQKEFVLLKNVLLFVSFVLPYETCFFENSASLPSYQTDGTFHCQDAKVGGVFLEEQRTYQCLLGIYCLLGHKSSYIVCRSHKPSASQSFPPTSLIVTSAIKPTEGKLLQQSISSLKILLVLILLKMRIEMNYDTISF